MGISSTSCRQQKLKEMQMSTERPIPVGKMVFRKTNAHAGRSLSVTPANSTNRHLYYARILLGPSVPSVSFETEDRETGLLCLAGEADVTLPGQSFQLKQYDALYVPRDMSIKLQSSSSADVAEFSAPVRTEFPVQFIPYSSVREDSSLSFKTGTPGQQRHVNIVIGKNVQAGRLLLGFTLSDPGNWTSWPPHEHAVMLEEMYVYINMPRPSFGIQLVYTDTEYPELVTVVRDGDAVLMPAGYHPNVSVPNHRIGFMWAMAAHRENEDRQFGVVNVQPDFNQGSSGLEASRK
jgi:5-deoxy-glucuronate isomerase